MYMMVYDIRESSLELKNRRQKNKNQQTIVDMKDFLMRDYQLLEISFLRNSLKLSN